MTRSAVGDYLHGQLAYTLHKPARKKYKRNKTYVAGIDTQWQADLADMHGLASQNDGMRYILTVIDVFSKYAWSKPVRSKDAGAVANALKEVLHQARPRKLKRLQTDKGKEFFNNTFAALMRRHGISHFASESDQKTAVFERFNRTIKTRIYTFLSDRGTARWLDVIQELVQAYNNSFHRTIGMAPNQVRKQDEPRLWVKMYDDGDTLLKPKIPKGAMVRLNKVKGVFDKGYLPNLSKEHFQVKDVPETKRGAKRPVYKLEDYSGEEVKEAGTPRSCRKLRIISTVSKRCLSGVLHQTGVKRS